ncbi:hypothetical protein PAHAL_7G255100 [Panicum hallii]|uniref:Uncharacterized protein n=1 Tax=Panicum hallii TaxID=206008 RepID=A0A2S3I9J2_9POAL|nr:hypothetical protein PAHAL_7G255100 [Panicum hallii]
MPWSLQNVSIPCQQMGPWRLRLVLLVLKDGGRKHEFDGGLLWPDLYEILGWPISKTPTTFHPFGERTLV